MFRKSPLLAPLVALGVLMAVHGVAAQTSAAGRSLGDLSLEELLNIEVVVPTKTARPLRESPAIVTVIDRDEIVRSGARDLIDVLQLVPGFSFGVDVFGTVGLGFRGNWGLEGKILVLLDGHEMNETLFLTVLFGHHFPVEHIERIEIIRGPGSVIYGGYAELATISITTRTADSLDGMFAAVNDGQMGGTRGFTDLSVSAAHTFANGVSASASAYVGDGIRSKAVYRDIFGTSYPLTNAALDPHMVNLQFGWKGLQIKYLLDRYDLTERDAFDESLSAAGDNQFHQDHVLAEYRWQVHKRLSLTPRVTYKTQTQFTPGPPPAFYHKTGEKALAGVTADLAINQTFGLLAGTEWAWYRARLDDRTHIGEGGQVLFAEGETDTFHTSAVFAELSMTHHLANVSLGLRVEDNQRFGRATLPRVGVTRVFGRFHTKLLFSEAFKAPGHENYALNLTLGPERTRAYEVETGYQVSKHLFAGVNVFHTTIRDPIIFFFDPSIATGTYINEQRTGTHGLEAETRLKLDRWSATARYAFYRANADDSVALYAVPNGTAHRGLPQHTFTLNGTADLGRGWSFNPSLLYVGARYGTLDMTPSGEPGFGKEDAVWLLNAFALYEWKGFSLRAGMHNLLDQSFRFLQPYDSGHAPLPGPTRELTMRLAYTYRFTRH